MPEHSLPHTVGRLLCPEPLPLELGGRRVAVLGAARSGVGCSQLLARAGASVVVADGKAAEALDVQSLDRIAATGAELRFGVADLDVLGTCDLLVISPGVPYDAPLVEQARAAGVPVTGEIELGYRFCRRPILAVTGTNAKGSTCTLMGSMLNSSGVRTRVCGNIGDPFTGALASEEPPDAYVLEISSFQLETIEHFRAAVGCVLNISDDHLDRHGSLGSYIAAKARLFENQTPDDWAVVNADDPNVGEAARALRGRAVRFSARGAATEARIEEDRLLVDLGEGPEEVCRRGDLIRAGAPYIETVLAAASGALLAGASAEGLLEAIHGHALPAEVLELVCEAGGVRFINSSKATNPAAAIADIESVSGPLLLIAGGLERGSDFTELGRVARERAKGLFLIGECADRIAEAAGTEGVRCASLEEAVERAHAAAAPGDAVLLAPACASWDMFRDYKVRGEVFRRTARRLCANDR
ncbi:MAG: UDP-N-acetylmuramoyl-L-alanine--D-glutamate ligase [Armatimonadetes bacterium]|nr:UDP-N-acetylmuramoyl-L-alanine--D-glutamate ligase [Armatimonadota bacterium]